jgi:hypothetical protein
VSAVKADPEEGPDGELYGAMGFVRRSERKSGLRRFPAPTRAQSGTVAAPQPVG